MGGDKKRKRGKDEEEEEEEDQEQQSEQGSENENEGGEDDGSDQSSNGEGENDHDDSNDEENDDDDDEEEEEEEEEEEDDAPKGRARSSRTAATASKSNAKTTKTTAAAAKKKKAATATKAKKSKATKSKSKVKSETKKKKTTASSSSSNKIAKVKVLGKFERLEEARKAYKWWEAPKLSAGVNWLSLEHPGVAFPQSYVKHGIPLYYDGQPVTLNAEQEEIASFYASMPEDGPQLGNPKTRKVFQKNFFDDFKESLGSGHVIRSFDKCDFERIRSHLDEQKSLKKAATDAEKLVKKREKEKMVLQYGYALIDGRIEKMGNFNMEPPGLFRGRGEHPKTGKLKKRCFPESVAINVSIDACVPRCPLPGHAWESVRHDPSVTWLASWNENVQNQNKYVMLAASSSFKGMSDVDKYSKAIRLKGQIHKVRKDYTSKINSKVMSERQLGVAMWVIDQLALRVGGEKGEDEADTVGCCSLRVEHITFNPDPEVYELELEFLGKDSMLFKQNINFASKGDLAKVVFQRIKSFCQGKRPDADVFDTLSPPVLNKHLNSLMKGLTAKVFRTYNASITLEEMLPSAEEMRDLTPQDKVVRYNAANREVAILCNHQKTVSKATETMFENLHEKLATLKDQRNELIKWKALASKKKADKIPLKEDDKDVVERLQAVLALALKQKETAVTNEEKLSAAAAVEAARADLKQDQRRRHGEKHMYKTTPTEHSLDSRIEKWAQDIRKMEVDIRNRDENKEVALGTSKINYMDPRISVAWCKRCELPIEKIFAKTLRDKFNWAMAVPPDWKFE